MITAKDGHGTADLLIVDGNSLTDIAATERIRTPKRATAWR